MPVSMRSAPATDNAGVISGWIGSPSICVVFVVVTFNEPLGIGVAVTKRMFDDDDGPLEFLDVPEALFVPAADEVLAPLTEDDGFAELAVDEASLVDFGGV